MHFLPHFQKTWQSRDAGVNYYGMFSPPFRLGAEFLLARSRASKDNCGPFPRGQGWRNLPNAFKMMKNCSGSSKTYRRLSPTIRFAHNLTLFSMLTGATDRATNDDSQTTVQSDSECSPFAPNQ